MLLLVVLFIVLVIAGTLGLYLLTRTIGLVMGTRTLRELRVTEMICNEHKVPASWLGNYPLEHPASRRRLIRQMKRHISRQKYHPALQQVVVSAEVQQHLNQVQDRLGTEDLSDLVADDPALRHATAVIDASIITAGAHYRLLQRIMHDGYRIILCGEPAIPVPKRVSNNLFFSLHPFSGIQWASVDKTLSSQQVSPESVVLVSPALPLELPERLRTSWNYCESRGCLEPMLHHIEERTFR